MAEMKTFNGYEVVDAKARQDIANIHTPTKVSELENDANYLTEHQSLDGKADKVHTHKLNEITDYKEPDLSEYAKKTDIPSLDNVTTKEYVDTADKKHTQDIANLTHHIQNIIEPTIMQKSDKGHKHTMSEITDYVAPVIPSLNGYATEQYVDDAISGIEPPETDLTGYATEQYVDSTKLAILDIYNCNEVSGTYILTDNVKNILRRLWDGERFPIVIAPYSYLQYIPSNISVTSDKIKITLDTSHGTTGGKLTQLSTDSYVFTNTNGSINLEVQISRTDVVDSYEYSQQLAALEARVAALEGK